MTTLPNSKASETSATENPTKLSLAEIASHRALILGQIAFQRAYTKQLLESVPSTDWYQIPDGAATCIAWQVGHLAVSQYGLMLFRQRGRAEHDLKLMPGWLRKKFGRGSDPKSITSEVASRETLLESLDSIHETTMREVPELPLEGFLETVDMPYAVFPNRLGALAFCPLHEAIHSGQIGVTRRLLGLDPIR